MCRNLLAVFSAVLLLGAVDDVNQSQTSRASADKTKPSALDADPHLVGWWKLDEATGKTAADSSRHGRNGRLEGGLRFDRDSDSGHLAQALKLAGGDGFLEINGYQGITGTQPRTVAAWIKTKSRRGELIAWGEDDFGKMWVFGFVRGHLGVTPGGGYLYIHQRIDDDRWHHVAAVVEKGEPPNLHDSVKLYVDGASAKIHDIGLLDLWPIETGRAMNVRIGKNFNGLLDDVRIYDRALREEEVHRLFQQK